MIDKIMMFMGVIAFGYCLGQFLMGFSWKRK